MSKNPRSEQVKALIKLLDTNPEIADKLLGALKNPQAALNKSADSNQAELDPAVLSAITTGKMEVEKGPTLAGVYQGVSVCATCGKERKTYSTNKDGLITQHICSRCENKMSFMTEAQRVQYLQQGLSNDFLAITEAKFKVLQQRFEKNRKLQTDKYKQFGRAIKGDGQAAASSDAGSVAEEMQVMPFDVNPKGQAHDKDKEELDKE
jgi:ribosomal protein L31